MEGGMRVGGGGAESEKVLWGVSLWVGGGREGGTTSAVLGTLSQKTSILRSPRVVCSWGIGVGSVDGALLALRVVIGDRLTVTDMIAFFSRAFQS